MTLAFVAVCGVLLVASTTLAFRSNDRGKMLLAFVLNADFVMSWIVQFSSDPPLRPFLYAVNDFIILGIILINRAKFIKSPILGGVFPAAYLAMLFVNLAYLALHGFDKAIYYGVLDVVYLALVITNLVSSMRNGHLEVVRHRRGAAISGGDSHNVRD